MNTKNNKLEKERTIGSDERKRGREKRRRRNDGVDGWCCRCCSTGLIAFERLWARRSPPPLNTCFSDFIRCYPSFRTLLCACTLRGNTSDASLASNAPVCAVHNRVVLIPETRERDKGDLCFGPLNTYLLAYRRISDRGQTVSVHSLHPFCVFHRHLFSTFPRTKTFFFLRKLRNKDRYEFANIAIITLPTSRLSATNHYAQLIVALLCAVIRWKLRYYVQLFRWK